MTKIIYKFFTMFLCFFASGNLSHASSVFISSMTLLSTKPIVSYQKQHVEKISFQQKEQECMALGLYHEARGEPFVGQYAVGVTILNRVRSSVYPSTVCGVVFQNEHKKFRCQFSFACDGISDIPRNKKSYAKMLNLAFILLNNGYAREAKFIGSVFQSSADDMTHYHRHDVQPTWSAKLQKLSKLGDHVFFKSNRVTKRYKF